MRLSREQMFMEIAHVVAKRSTCARLNVGAIITHNARVVSIGYNGRASGEAHCEGNECSGVVPGGCGTIHAEDNAIRHLPHIPGHEPRLELYVTHACCPQCARKIIEDGRISHVYYSTPYRDETGLRALIEEGLIARQITPAGYIMDYATRCIVTP